MRGPPHSILLAVPAPGGRDARACKCCGTAAPPFGTVDFSTSCQDITGKVFPDSGKAVTYHRCPSCGFLFTTFLDPSLRRRSRAASTTRIASRPIREFAGSRPTRGLANMAACMAEGGMLLFTTQLQPRDIARGLDWWYVAMRR